MISATLEEMGALPGTRVRYSSPTVRYARNGEPDELAPGTRYWPDLTNNANAATRAACAGPAYDLPARTTVDTSSVVPDGSITSIARAIPLETSTMVPSLAPGCMTSSPDQTAENRLRNHACLDTSCRVSTSRPISEGVGQPKWTARLPESIVTLQKVDSTRPLPNRRST